mmetsp:Transcript_55326/g.133423  ORF Transcript_55326/g.133423 Transcript_55326/m.133423 type:complete len:215 (+) Transcript_55326:94-738(+)
MVWGSGTWSRAFTYFRATSAAMSIIWRSLSRTSASSSSDSAALPSCCGRAPSEGLLGFFVRGLGPSTAVSQSSSVSSGAPAAPAPPEGSGSRSGPAQSATRAQPWHSSSRRGAPGTQTRSTSAQRPPCSSSLRPVEARPKAPEPAMSSASALEALPAARHTTLPPPARRRSLRRPETTSSQACRESGASSSRRSSPYLPAFRPPRSLMPRTPRR